jgi:membrane protein implicated in regulation of membrane protease activity
MNKMNNKPKINDVVALLDDVPAAKLLRGQVGTVVDDLGAGNLLVEFSDDNGRAYAIATIETTTVLVLHYEQEMA